MSIQKQNKRHQDKIAHRKKQIRSGKSSDLFAHRFSSGKREQSPSLIKSIADKLGIHEAKHV